MCEPRHQIATSPDAPVSPYQPLTGVIGSIWGVIVSNRASRACEGYLSVNPTRSLRLCAQTRFTYLLAGCRTMSYTCGSILLATPPAEYLESESPRRIRDINRKRETG